MAEANNGVWIDKGVVDDPIESLAVTALTGPKESVELNMQEYAASFGQFPRYIHFMYKIVDLTTSTGTKSIVATPRWGDLSLTQVGRGWYYPAAAGGGGPNHDGAAWISSGTTMTLKGDSLTDLQTSFLVGLPNTAGTGYGGENLPLYHPYFWMEFVQANFTGGTFSWWARIIK